MPEDQWNAVDAHAATLADLLEAAHVRFHGGESFDYSPTEENVTKIVVHLQEIVDDGAWSRGYYKTSPNEFSVDSEPQMSGE